MISCIAISQIFTNINRFNYYVNVKFLFYEIDDYGCFYIEIRGNNQKISDELINELAQVNVKISDV